MEDANDVNQWSTFVWLVRRGHGVFPDDTQQLGWKNHVQTYIKVYSKQICWGNFQATLLDSTMTELEESWVPTGSKMWVHPGVTELLNTLCNGSTKVARICDLYDTSLLQLREPRLNITPIFLDCLPLTHSHSAWRTQGAPSVPCTTNNDDQIAPIFINPLPLSLQLLSKYSTTDFISWGYLIYEYHMVPDKVF